MLVHVGADAGLGFDIGGSVGGLRPTASAASAVSHGSGHDQVSIGHFLIGDEIANPPPPLLVGIFGHRVILVPRLGFKFELLFFFFFFFVKASDGDFETGIGCVTGELKSFPSLTRKADITGDCRLSAVA